MPRLGVVCGCVAISRSDEIDKYSHVWPVFVVFCEALDPGYGSQQAVGAPR